MRVLAWIILVLVGGACLGGAIYGAVIDTDVRLALLLTLGMLAFAWIIAWAITEVIR